MLLENSSLQQYSVLAVEPDAGLQSRALIAGPGIPAGVWYPVASERAAETLVLDLNLALFYARQVKAGVRRRRRTVKAAQLTPATRAVS